MATSEEDLESLLRSFPRSSSPPFLHTWNTSISRRGSIDLSTGSTPFHGGHSSSDQSGFQRSSTPGRVLLQGSTTDSRNSQRRASTCLLQGPSTLDGTPEFSSPIYPLPPLQIPQSTLPQLAYLNHQPTQADNHAPIVPVAQGTGSHIDDNLMQYLRQFFEDRTDSNNNTIKEAPLGSTVGSGQGMTPSNRAAMASCSADSSSLERAPMDIFAGQENLPMRKNPTNGFPAGSEVLSMMRSPSIIGIEGVSRRDHCGNAADMGNDVIGSQSSDILQGTELTSMRRSTMDGIFHGGVSSMKKTAGINGILGEETMYMNPSLRNGSSVNRQLSSGRNRKAEDAALLQEYYEQLLLVPEIHRNYQAFNSKQKELQYTHADSFEPFEPSSFVTGVAVEVAPHHGDTKDLDTDLLGHSRTAYELHDNTHLLSQIRQKRLELQELESRLHVASEYSPASSSVNAPQLVKYDKLCKFHALGKCIKGAVCPFLHVQKVARDMATLNPEMNELLQRSESAGDLSLSISDATQRLMNCSLTASGSSRSSHVSHHGLKSSLVRGPLYLDDYRVQQQQEMFKRLEDLEGNMVSAAKNQLGCRFLQSKMEEGKPEDCEKIFKEIIQSDIVELTMDPFANYCIQKLLEVCSSGHYRSILEALTKQENLVTISLNIHGTRVVQRLIERVENCDQACMVISSLESGTLRLVKDSFGNHVVQRCLLCLSNEDCQFIYDAVAVHCEEVASDRFGCCVLQRCLDFGSEAQRKQLVAALSACAVVLSQNPFGNYVVQYVLYLDVSWASKEVISKLQGKYAELAIQKYSSNVVEKCLKGASDDDRVIIVKELMEASVLSQLLQDPFGNFVIQSALEVTQGNLPTLHKSLVNTILSYACMLSKSHYGKRILACSYLKN